MQNNEAVDEVLSGVLLADEADDAADVLRSEVGLGLGSLLEMAAEDLKTTGYGLRSVSRSDVRARRRRAHIHASGVCGKLRCGASPAVFKTLPPFKAPPIRGMRRYDLIELFTISVATLRKAGADTLIERSKLRSTCAAHRTAEGT